jgi:hypothetical protein
MKGKQSQEKSQRDKDFLLSEERLKMVLEGSEHRFLDCHFP